MVTVAVPPETATPTWLTELLPVTELLLSVSTAPAPVTWMPLLAP